MRDYFLSLGGGNEIGASCYLLRIGGLNILIDAGMRLNSTRAFPDFSPLNTYIGGLSEIHAFFLTHAHLDHCGAITRVHYEANKKPKYATKPTLEIASLMLSDALRIKKGQTAEDWHLIETTRELLEETISSFNVVSYENKFVFSDTNAFATAFPAGHILGASSFLFEINGRTVLHTGDICLHDQRTIKGIDLDRYPSNVDLLIIESTYAYQPFYRDETVEEQYFALAHFVSDVINRNGRILIPAFAVGRAQEIACLFADIFEQKLIPPFPVRLDGLVKPICEVYDQNRSFMQGRLRSKPGHIIYNQYVKPTPVKYYPTRGSVENMPPSCIISSSGMLLDGTRSAIYAEYMLEKPNDAIAFSGYVDDESPGRRLLNLAQKPDRFRVNGKDIQRVADITQYHLSAHAPSQDLRKIICATRPKQVILIHGDYRYTGNAEFLQFLLELESQGVIVHQANNGTPVYL